MIPSLFAPGARQERHSPSQPEALDFSALVRGALASVNRYQVEAAGAAEALALGEVQDVHSVMLATAKADLALQLTISIRNKVIEAYQEISRMQI